MLARLSFYESALGQGWVRVQSDWVTIEWLVLYSSREKTRGNGCFLSYASFVLCFILFVSHLWVDWNHLMHTCFIRKGKFSILGVGINASLEVPTSLGLRTLGTTCCRVWELKRGFSHPGGTLLSLCSSDALGSSWAVGRQSSFMTQP